TKLLLGGTLCTRVRHAPDAVRTIVGEYQRAVARYGDSDRTAPYIGIIHDEAGDEIFIFTGGLSVRRGDSNDFVARAVGAIPRPMRSHEDIAPIFGRKLLPIIEG